MNSKPRPNINLRGLAGPEIAGKDEVAPSISPVSGTAESLWHIEEYVTRPAKQVPVINEVDVVVVGAGVAGIIAALAAARHGAKTLVVDSFSALGGNMGPGYNVGGTLCLALHNPEAFPDGLRGIPEEFNRRVVEGENRNVGGHPGQYGSQTSGVADREMFLRDSNAVSYVSLKMLEEAGAEVLLSSPVVDVLKEGDAVRGVFVETKSGTLAIRSRVVIDCTGTGDVAERAGAPMIALPTNPSGGVYYIVAGADWQRYRSALTERGPLSADDKAWLETHAPESALFMPWVREAWENNEFYIVDTVDDFATIEVTVHGPCLGNEFMGGRTRINGNFNPGDALAISRIDQKMRIYLFEFVEFLRKRVPGFEKAYLHLVSPFTHFRGGKSIESEYVVSYDDVKRSARFDDMIFIYYDDKEFYAGGCDVPYRMLIPKNIDGLLAAGKSAVKRGPQIRQRCFLQLMGQAAGVAAALAVKNKIEPREIDVKELQQVLYALGSEMGPPARAKELGLL